MSEQVLLGVDAGGTFTDFVCVRVAATTEITIYKTPSTPEAPERAILTGIRAMGLETLAESGGLHIIHGSTVATNAVLEGNLARTVFIANRGFGDLLTLARQTRPQLYGLEFDPSPPPVPRALCLESPGRIAADGREIEALLDTEIDTLVEQIYTLQPDAVAINLLFSFLNDDHERRIEAAIQQRLPDISVSRSSRVLPEYKEYERGVATWLNAALGPVISGYLKRLQARIGRSTLQIMQSSGETIGAGKAADAAVNLLLSGPAGGLKAIQFLGQHPGYSNQPAKIISFDMGGTSTDVALVDGEVARTTEGTLAQYPIGVSMVDMHTIGAGGGSIAYVDNGGMLQVGPQSAGAEPGPACYGKGGIKATVTDANLVLGRLDPATRLAGDMSLDLDAANRVIAALAEQLHMSTTETAAGIVSIANEHMAKAIRLISVNRGYHPDEFVLACFGGAGGLHVCALAEAMQMRRAIVPVHGGVLSALGMVVANRGRQFSRTLGLHSSTADVDAVMSAFNELHAVATDELAQEGLLPDQLHTAQSIDMRYVGQSYTLNVPWQAPDASHHEALKEVASRFHAMHEQRYGYSLSTPTELVNIRVQVTAESVSWSLPPMAPPVAKDGNNLASATVYSPANGHAVTNTGQGTLPVYQRHRLAQGASIRGPAIITEYAATTYVASGWLSTVDATGNLMLNQISPG